MKSLLTVHATMTPSTEVVTTRAINRRDREFGYSSIGYHYVIERDGTLGTGRKMHEASMHDSVEEAKLAISVCLVGGSDAAGSPDDNFTDDQWDRLVTLTRELTAGKTLSIQSRTPSVTTDRIVRIVLRPRN